jgi:hypothetical protein
MALLSGCAHMSLKEQAMREIRVQPVDASLCPGQETKITVTALLADGREVATTGAGHGKVGWDNYRTAFSGGTAKDGKLRLSRDPRVTWSEPASLVVAAIDHPDVRWSGTIPIRYDCALGADLTGKNGSTGERGKDGSDGETVGARGRSGRSGGTGEPGAHGQSVEIWMTTVAGPQSKKLVQAAVRGSGERSFYAFDPAGGTLAVDASGGDGGPGGDAGDGGKGGDASADVKQGRGGDGAVGGCGGDGGDGGDVLLHLDPQARAHVDHVKIRVDGGRAGLGGTYGSGGKGTPKGRDGRTGCEGQAGRSGHVQTVEEPIAPLW